VASATGSQASEVAERRCDLDATISHRLRPSRPKPASPSAIIVGMSKLQRIHHNGQLAAIVLADQAIVDDALPPAGLLHVQAKCLCALQIRQASSRGPTPMPKPTHMPTQRRCAGHSGSRPRDKRGHSG